MGDDVGCAMVKPLDMMNEKIASILSTLTITVF
jgi:hypothetical protein